MLFRVACLLVFLFLAPQRTWPQQSDIDDEPPPETMSSSEFEAYKNKIHVENLRFTSANDLLPIPADPSDLHINDQISPEGLGSGITFANANRTRSSSAPASSDLAFRIYANGIGNMAYNTGPGSGSLKPATFASASTPGSRNYTPDGQFSLGTSAVNLKSDIQVQASSPIQGYINLDYDGESVLVQEAYGRFNDIIVGKTWSAFCDSDALPQTIVMDEAPAGAVFRKQASFQYHYLHESGFMLGAALESPSSSDCYVARTVNGDLLENGTAIQTFPDVVGRVRYRFPDNWSNVQVATLFRELAYNDIQGNHLTPAWGLSTNACVLICNNDIARMGVVGGEGVGSYLFGLDGDTTAGGVTGVGRPIDAAPVVGAYAAYQHYWTTNLWSTFAYGFAESEGSMLLRNTTRQTQNTWINLIWAYNEWLFTGLQYDYGLQILQDGQTTPNQQIQFTVQLRATPVNQAKSASTRGPSDRGVSAPEPPSSGRSNRRL
jgi:hypothetical protein